jgi:hypothetical protein
MSRVVGKRGEGSRRRIITNGGWQRVIRLTDEVYADYLSGMVALRKRVVEDMRRNLRDGEVLDRPHLEQPQPQDRPAPPMRINVREAADLAADIRPGSRARPRRGWQGGASCRIASARCTRSLAALREDRRSLSGSLRDQGPSEVGGLRAGRPAATLRGTSWNSGLTVGRPVHFLPDSDGAPRRA